MSFKILKNWTRVKLKHRNFWTNFGKKLVFQKETLNFVLNNIEFKKLAVIS